MAAEQISSKEVAESSSYHHVVWGSGAGVAAGCSHLVLPRAAGPSPGCTGKDALPRSLERLLAGSVPRGLLRRGLAQSLATWASPRSISPHGASHPTAACFSEHASGRASRRASKGDSRTAVSTMGNRSMDVTPRYLCCSLLSEARPTRRGRGSHRTGLTSAGTTGGRARRTDINEALAV